MLLFVPFFSTSAAQPPNALPPLAPPPTDYLAESLSPPLQPPSGQESPLSAAEAEAAAADAMSWCATHGLLVHAPMATGDDGSTANAAPRLIHAPFSLLPATFPRAQLDLASKELAPLFGSLVDRIGRDVPWLASTLRLTSESDDFTRRLLQLCAAVHKEGATQEARLAILRSDYMLHEPEGAASGGGRLLQVELNTIASSFGALCSRVCALHTRLAQRWPGVRHHVWSEAGQPKTLSLPTALPRSPAIEELAGALADAHAEYLSGRSSSGGTTSGRGGDGRDGEPAVLLVVQPGERNAIDQQLLCEHLWDVHGVRVVRRTLAQLAHEAKLVGSERRLVLTSTGTECSVAYFRCGYTPDDYPTQRQWDARLLVERSFAIKCPCIEHHLVGCKKVQQQLCLAGELERFMSADESATLRQCFAGLWSLSGPEDPSVGAPAEEHAAAQHMRLAKERPSEYVMKPQREGGGHNFFGAELASALSTLSREQRSAFILMQRILPKRAPAVLVRDGHLTVGQAVSELGVYSTLLTGRGGKILRNAAAGHLVRTKLDGVDEGGVAAGFAVLSSPLASGPPASRRRSWLS